MSYAKRINQKNRLPPFVPIFWEILNSSAYRDLPPSAAKALPYFIGKDGAAKRKEGANYSGEFELSYGEATRHGFATRTYSRIIKDLVDKGFVDPAEYGGLRGFCKTTNKFKISERWRDYGKSEFTDKRWERTVENI